MKTDKQWCQDNGVPEDARHTHLFNGYDVIKMLNGMLKNQNLRIRTKQRRGYTGSYVWIESSVCPIQKGVKNGPGN
jgi:hypothetical protein